jgi:DNA-binding GntR family transcriptional regulator
MKRQPNLTQQAYNSVREGVLEGILSGGMHLSESVIAERLGFSKSPVREAFCRLEIEGFLEVRPRYGAKVRALRPDEVSGLFEVLSLFEEHAVDTSKIDDSLLDNMKRCVERMDLSTTSRDKAEHLRAYVEFHGLVAHSSGNCEFSKTYISILHKAINSASIAYGRSLSVTAYSHRKIFEAFANARRYRAKRLLRCHLNALREG